MPTKTIIKVCGLTRLDEALACSELGVQWLGFNCFRGSKRYLPPEAIATIIQQLPSEVKTVGVFVNSSSTEIEEILQQTGMHLAQLHGDESPDFANALQVPWFRAFRVMDDLAEEEIRSYGQELFCWMLRRQDSMAEPVTPSTGRWQHVCEIMANCFLPEDYNQTM